jgi:hydrogenase/urease accessory protein HupE
MLPYHAHAVVHLGALDPPDEAIALVRPLEAASDDPTVLAAEADALRRDARRGARGARREARPAVPARARRRRGEGLPLRRAASLLLGVLATVALLAIARPASAHTIGISRGEYTPGGPRVRVTLTLRGDEAATATPGLDANGDGHVTAAEVDRARASLKAAFIDPLAIDADGARCTPALDDATFDAPDGIRLSATYACPRAAAHLHLRFGFLDRMPAAHRHLATVHLPRGDVDTLAVLARPDVDVDTGAAASVGFVSMLRGGVEHILTGADHLAFLLALVLSCTLATERKARVGALVAMLSAFTVGHTGSLAVATLGGFAPRPRLVEPLVALSVAYVGAENLVTRSVRHRWMLTLLFGFVHGFAFAGGLLPLGLPRAQLPGALFAFNLGVEVGQLLVLALLLPPLAVFASRAWYPPMARGLSAAIVLVGVLWFVQRVA